MQKNTSFFNQKQNKNNSCQYLPTSNSLKNLSTIASTKRFSQKLQKGIKTYFTSSKTSDKQNNCAPEFLFKKRASALTTNNSISSEIKTPQFLSKQNNSELIVNKYSNQKSFLFKKPMKQKFIFENHSSNSLILSISSKNSLNTNEKTQHFGQFGGNLLRKKISQNTQVSHIMTKNSNNKLFNSCNSKSPLKYERSSQQPKNITQHNKPKHTRHASSYTNLQKKNDSIYTHQAYLQKSLSTLNNHSNKPKQSFNSPFIKQNPFLPNSQSRTSILSKLSLNESQVNICVSQQSDQQQDQKKDDDQMTARFNVIQKLENSNTSLGQKTKYMGQQQIKSISLNQFIIGPCKGKGRYGKVYMAIDKKSGLVVALKEISLKAIKQMTDQFIQQIKLQMFMNHPYIVKVYGFFLQNQNFYIIMEYMEQGCLYELIRRKGALPQKQATLKIYQISQALYSMHKFNIIHRDLKPQNIVLTFNMCKLCDFSWATRSTYRRQTNCGTLDYLSPEIIQGNQYNNSIDLWSMGVLLYEILVGKPPFYNLSMKQTVKRIKQCNFTLPSNLSQNACNLIQCFLKKDPSQRKELDEILSHPFFQQVQQ